MRRLLTVLVVTASAATAVVALVDAFRGSSSESKPPQATVSNAQIRLPSWEGVRRRTIRLDRAVGATWEEIGVLDPGHYALTVRIELPHSADA